MVCHSDGVRMRSWVMEISRMSMFKNGNQEGRRSQGVLWKSCYGTKEFTWVLGSHLQAVIGFVTPGGSPKASYIITEDTGRLYYIIFTCHGCLFTLGSTKDETNVTKDETNVTKRWNFVTASCYPPQFCGKLSKLTVALLSWRSTTDTLSQNAPWSKFIVLLVSSRMHSVTPCSYLIYVYTSFNTFKCCILALMLSFPYVCLQTLFPIILLHD